jgi:hypothetical protein
MILRRIESRTLSFAGSRRAFHIGTQALSTILRFLGRFHQRSWLEVSRRAFPFTRQAWPRRKPCPVNFAGSKKGASRTRRALC